MSTRMWIAALLFAVSTGLALLAISLFVRWMWLFPLTPEQRRDKRFVKDWLGRCFVPMCITVGLIAGLFGYLAIPRLLMLYLRCFGVLVE